MTNAVAYLEKAAQHMKDRAALRDTPEGERSMAKAVQAFNIIYGTNLTETQGWEFMTILKKVRGCQGHYHEDDYEDDVAYAALAAESAYKENNNANKHDEYTLGNGSMVSD